MKTSSIVSLSLSASMAAAQAGCATSQACAFPINVAGCGIGQISDGQIRAVNVSAISQIADGQARCALPNVTPSTFTLTNGGVRDNAGRTCEISNQNQFQCNNPPTTGARTTGFAACNGKLAFNGNTGFVACLATGSIPGYNLYTADVDRSTVTQCMPVDLIVPACPAPSSSCVASTVTVTSTVQQPAQTVTSTVQQPAQTVTVTATRTVAAPAPPAQTTMQRVPAPAPAPAPSACFNIVNALGSKSYPRTILGVNSNQPNTPIGVQYIPKIGNGGSSVFTFDYQQPGTCSLNFLFPTKQQIQAVKGTTDYTLTGGDSIAVTLYQLASPATDAAGLTFANKPARVASFTGTLTPGSNTTFATFACPAGTSVSYELVANGASTLSFFEDYNLPPMGLTLGQCA